MNLDEMSDKAISEMLLDLINPEWREQASMHLAKNNLYSGTHAYYSVTMPDYCNNWSDMGPLIAEHKISLIEFGGSWEAEIETRAPIGAFGTDEVCSITVVDKNPLRAAAICLIKKLEAEND